MLQSEPNAVLFCSKTINCDFRKSLCIGNELEINNKYYNSVLQIYDYTVDTIPLNQRFDACILYDIVPSELDRVPECAIQIIVTDKELEYIEGWEICTTTDVDRVIEALQAHYWPVMETKQPIEYSMQDLLNWKEMASKMNDMERREFISDRFMQFDDSFDD